MSEAAELRALYAAPLTEFMARRTELAAAARRAGDKEQAKRITSWRKPTVAANLINRFAVTDPSVIDAVTQMHRRVRALERTPDLRAQAALAKERTALVQDLLARAAPDASASIQQEVTDTFRAALADPSIAEQVFSGTLLRAVAFDGYGFTGTAGLTVLPGGAAGVADTDVPAPDTAAGDEAADEAADNDAADNDASRNAAADSAAADHRTHGTGATAPPGREKLRQQRLLERRRLRTAVAEASAAADAAEDALDQAQETVAELEDRLAQLTALLEGTRGELTEARAAAEHAAQELHRHQETVTSLTSRLADLRKPDLTESDATAVD